MISLGFHDHPVIWIVQELSLEKAEFTEKKKKTHQSWSDKACIQVRAAPWLCLLGQVPGPLRGSICFKGNDIPFLRESTSKLNVQKHLVCNKS